MSHFVTLVDFYMPEVEENLEETAHYKAQIAEAKEALAQSQGGNSFTFNGVRYFSMCGEEQSRI